jgi:hypothetical protein
MRFLLVMALALLLPACAEVQMATTEADVQGKRFSPRRVKLRSMSIARACSPGP